MRKPEAVLLAVGLALLAVFVTIRTYSIVASSAALREFKAADGVLPDKRGSAPGMEVQNASSGIRPEKRSEAGSPIPVGRSDGPIAVLTIKRLSLEVPVFDGIGERVLSRGAGRIPGTARPGQSGNMGIAGHRDLFFRKLKDLRIGDRVVLSTRNGKHTYTVDRLDIVVPDDVSVLQPGRRPAITLVTCYPFYFVGHAPKRYIAHASIAQQDLQGNR